MVVAGGAFAFANVAMQWVTMNLQMSSPSATFWQYFISLIFMVPVIWRLGLRSLKTERPGLHLFRVVLAALGVQFWVAGLANSVPIWQAIALVMTSPFFVTIGAALLLGEKANAARWGATVIGFVGGMVILSPWDEGFRAAALLPVIAAVLWGASILCMKKLEEDETPQSVTLYLLLFMAPINLVLAAGSGFEVPSSFDMWWMLVVAGLLGALANISLAMAYERADAAFLQPFDHLKLLLNVFCGFVFFAWVPPGNLWIGALLIVGASMFILRDETR